ncbi:MAG: hypothetical protein LEGION0398_MBIBDBAK_00141 [Legionellaceae bacterium]
MFRNIFLLLLFSLLIVFFMPALHWLAIKLYQFELILDSKTKFLFNHHVIGYTLRKTLLLTFTPVILVGIPAGIYGLITRRTLPYLSAIIWTIWLVLSLIFILPHH